MIKDLLNLHIIVGYAFLLIFLLTGVYLLISFPDLYAGREEVRMMYRSNHIYLLMAALINILYGHLFTIDTGSTAIKSLKAISGGIVALAPIDLLGEFIVEPPQYLVERPITFWGILALIVGVVFTSLLALVARLRP